MSLYLNTDADEEYPLATVAGWGLVGDWADQLDAAKYPETVHLWEHGWCQDVPALRAEIGTAPPPHDRNAAHTLDALKETLRKIPAESAVVVYDGMSREAGAKESLSPNDDEEEVSEFAYSIVSEADRSGLIKKQITDKTGKKTTVWVRATQPEPKPDRRAAKDDARGKARAAVEAALAEPAKADPKELAAHLAALTRDEIQAINKAAGTRGGRLKADKIDKFLAHVKKHADQKPEVADGGSDTSGSGSSERESPEASRPVAGETGGPGDGGAGRGGETGDKPTGPRPPVRVPAEVGRVNEKITRFENFFRANGQHQVAEWMGKLRDHVNTVGVHAAIEGLGADRGAGDGGLVQYAGADEESGNWSANGHFVEEYLARHGIVPVSDELSPDLKAISSQTNRDIWGGDVPRAGDIQPQETPYETKLDEAQDLPGLETSEDIAKIVGKPVTHFTPEVIAKFDEKYGKGQWIVKTYGDHAFAGQGIYFPQRIAAVQQDARNTIWSAGENLARYEFSIARDKDGKAIGVQHAGGDRYDFGSKKYKDTINGDVRHWGDKAAEAAKHEHGTELAFGGKDFMAQPAFPVVGVTEEQRARGITHEGTGEGRTHVLTKADGTVELIPHSTWIKGEPLPVVFESEDTKAMARAAHEAVMKLPAKARAGQVYAPDIVRTKDGFKVVELNASVQYGGSGYLSDNPLVIDAYVSHLTGRTPAHVRFIRKLLSGKGK